MNDKLIIVNFNVTVVIN